MRREEIQQTAAADSKFYSASPLTAESQSLMESAEHKATANNALTSEEYLQCTDPFVVPALLKSSLYEVKTGDTLWQIARQELKRAGHENPTAHETKLELQAIISANKGNPAIPDVASGHILPKMQLIMPPDSSSLSDQCGSAAAYSNSNTADAKQTEAQPTRHSIASDSMSHHGRHHYLHDLHLLENKVLSTGKHLIDNLHHWLDAVAARAFLLAKQEAEAHGIHLQISSAGRSYQDQSRLYRQLHGRQSVALPGTSNHETGLALDITNWRQAKPYLLAHGFVHGDGHGTLRNDPWHFKYVGQKAEV